MNIFKRKKIWLMLSDAFIICVAALISYFCLSLTDTDLSDISIVIYIAFSVLFSLAALFVCGAYSGVWEKFGKRNYIDCVIGLIIGIAVSCFLIEISGHIVPAGFIALHFILTLIGVCAFRFLFRSAFITLVDAGKKQSKFARTMIIGAGEASLMLLEEIERAHDNPNWERSEKAFLAPVCIIDDDKSKTGQKLRGVEIAGTTDDIAVFAEKYGIQLIVFAIPSCTGSERKRIIDLCSETNIRVKVLPSIDNLILEDEKTTLLGQVRDINTDDLLEREPISFDNQNIRSFLNGKVCMVTGGGGSIGAELVRQIAQYEPEKIIIIDIYENNAYDIQQELAMEYGDKLGLVTLIASVRDYSRMNRIFEKYKPHIVFHAAAHKHVPLMEDSPMEAIKNNVDGTFNVATLAQFHKTEKFIMISTDKAVNPTNVMGASKRCCEMIMQYLAQQNDGVTEFITTRFGNVLGSNGSVIPLFRRQIEQGRPITVTHPDMIRYFMTIPEAVSLVLEAAASAHGGEIFVLDMGKPVKIVTLAENLIRMYGKKPYEDVEIKFTGLRPGEKIKEELLMNEEGLQKTDSRYIFIGKHIEIEPEAFIDKLSRLHKAALENDGEAAVKALHEIVPTFVDPEEYNEKALEMSAP